MSRSVKKKRHPLLTALLLAALLGLCLVDSQNRLVTSEYTCPVAALPDAFDGFRILQLSDLHGAEFGEGNARLLKAVAAAAPDIIALTGDFLEKEADLTVTAELLPALARLAPCYFVSGNHEWACGCMEELAAQLESSGVVYLNNCYLPLERDGHRILLCGVEDPNSWSDLAPPEQVVARAQRDFPDIVTVLLGHRNYWVEEYPALPVDVIFCGHGHGGLIRLPLVGGLIGTDRSFLPAYDAGCYSSGRYTMVVSRGLGNTFRSLRLFNNPEIVVVTLEKVS